MLSQKYLFTKKLLTKISKSDFLHSKLLILAKMYRDIDRGYKFSYLSDENGELEFLDKMSAIFKEDFIFFDVGAHVGNYTKDIVDRFSNYKGHLFDLSPVTLEHCYKQHGKNVDITINNTALSDDNGEVEYRFYPNMQMQTAISGVGPYEDNRFELKKATCQRGDDYCRAKNITHIHLLKIDTEGYDLHVLRGFKDMLASSKIDVIQFEYNIKSSETHSMLEDFYKFLESYGYKIGPLRKTGVEFQDFDFNMNDFETGPNFIACKKSFVDQLSNFA